MANIQAAEDIGRVGFAVFEVGQVIIPYCILNLNTIPFQNPEANASKAIAVLGDALTTQGMAESYQRGAGKPLNAVPNFVGKSLLAINKHTKDLYVSFRPPLRIENLDTTLSIF